MAIARLRRPWSTDKVSCMLCSPPYRGGLQRPTGRFDEHWKSHMASKSVTLRSTLALHVELQSEVHHSCLIDVLYFSLQTRHSLTGSATKVVDEVQREIKREVICLARNLLKIKEHRALKWRDHGPYEDSDHCAQVYYFTMDCGSKTAFGRLRREATSSEYTKSYMPNG